MAQSLSKIYIRINASALTGRLTDCHYTQGAALGYALVGLSARFGTKSETLGFYCFIFPLFGFKGIFFLFYFFTLLPLKSWRCTEASIAI